jgi:hypothetical protein
VEAFLVSTAVVALAEIGDKSQLLVLTLAANFRKPLPIILGVLAATLLNHAAAGADGRQDTASHVRSSGKIRLPAYGCGWYDTGNHVGGRTRGDSQRGSSTAIAVEANAQCQR